MANNHNTILSFHFLCFIIFILSAFSIISFLYWCHCSDSVPCYSRYQATEQKQNPNQPVNLLTYPSAWNHLSFSSEPPPKLLKIALFTLPWLKEATSFTFSPHFPQTPPSRYTQWGIYIFTSQNQQLRDIWTKLLYGSNFRLKIRPEGLLMLSTLRVLRSGIHDRGI